jgi:fatty-acyl-CoA synthase
MNLVSQALDVWNARRDKPMFTFLTPAGAVKRSFEQEIAEAKAFARGYRQKGVKSGDVVISILRHRVELVSAFLGALWIGAVPSFMPEPSEKQDLNYHWESHTKLFQRIGAKLLVTDQSTELDKVPHLANVTAPVWNIDRSEEGIDGDANKKQMRGAELEIPLNPSKDDAIAFLQHSSGTTALKKGVALTHRQVLAQMESYQKAIGMQPGETVVSWLPLYHDMGLIACFILPILCGAHVVMMSPFAWVRKPWTLLDAIERYRGDYCWLPNFAFNLLATTKPADRKWSLGHVKAFINCSEPCKEDTFRRFESAFASSGLRRDQLQVCYAMAETVFAITQTKLGESVVPFGGDGDQLATNHCITPSKGTRAVTFLPVGETIEGMRVQIFDENQVSVVEEGIVGEIGVAGPCLFEGYYKLPEETNRRRVGEWHLTGDLGFLYGGKLYVSGRKNDVIIVRGKKFHAFDIEHIVSGVAGIKPGRAVAFALENEQFGSEDAIVVAEVDSEGAREAENALRTAIKQAIYDKLGLTLADIHLVEPRWIIKTTSGKVSRHLNAEKYKLTMCLHV